MKLPTRSPPTRWTSSTANIGQRRQRRPGARPAIAMPSVTTPESSRYATMPAARAAYQSTGFEVA